MHVRWTTDAASDLEQIVERIAKDRSDAAIRTARTIYESLAVLKDFPNRGRIGRIQGTRELVFASLPYIAVYRVKSDNVEVLRIYHAAQDWPQLI